MGRKIGICSVESRWTDSRLGLGTPKRSAEARLHGCSNGLGQVAVRLEYGREETTPCPDLSSWLARKKISLPQVLRQASQGVRCWSSVCPCNNIRKVYLKPLLPWEILQWRTIRNGARYENALILLSKSSDGVVHEREDFPAHRGGRRFLSLLQYLVARWWFLPCVGNCVLNSFDCPLSEHPKILCHMNLMRIARKKMASSRQPTDYSGRLWHLGDLVQSSITPLSSLCRFKLISAMRVCLCLVPPSSSVLWVSEIDFQSEHDDDDEDVSVSEREYVY